MMINVPEKKYVKYYRTKDLGKGYYAHIAVLNKLGQKKFGRKTFVDKIRKKGMKIVERI